MERAVEWLFSHPDDTGDDTTASPSTNGPTQSPGGTSTLPAQYRLKAFVSHKGTSVHSGHYVAHIRKGDQGSTDQGRWVLFNDEKVVDADNENVESLRPLAYLYFFERF